MLGAIPAGAHGLHWNEDGIEPPPGADGAPANGHKAAARRASASAASRGASSSIRRSTSPRSTAGTREWADLLEPAGVTEADARAADARHLPDQAALSTAIFGAFARVVRERAGRSAHA